MIINPYLVIPAGPPAALDLEADTLVLNDNDPVETWTDVSGNGRNFTQISAPQKPTYKSTAGPGSRPCVRFDGGDYLTRATSGISPSPITIFSVLKPADTNPRTICSSNTGGLQFRINNLKQNFLKVNAVDMGSSTTSLSTVAFQQINVTYDGTTLNFRLNSSADGTAVSAQTLTAAVEDIGRQTVLNIEYFSGDICMLRIYTSVLTGPQIATVEAEILSRWGV